MIGAPRPDIGLRRALHTATALGLLTASLVLAACGGSGSAQTSTTGAHSPVESGPPSAPSTSTLPSGVSVPASSSAPTSSAPTSSAAEPPGTFTMAFAGDVHFADQLGTRLAQDPATVFGVAAPGLRRADLTMVNLETAITTGGIQQNKEFTFRAPPVAFEALRDAGIDVATMANNHGADYGTPGLQDSLAAEARYHFPVVGIGADAAQAYAPYTTTLNGTKVAILAADQVQDETTLRLYSSGAGKPGVANAYSSQLIDAVHRAKAAGYLVVVYVHWGIEYQTCPSGDQETLATALAHAGATAVIGTHAHVLQGDGWLSNGTFVAYGLGNYLWWRTFGNQQDDNGVLTLTFRNGRVAGQSFVPSHLTSSGVPVPATGADRARILAELQQDRSCTDLSASAPH